MRAAKYATALRAAAPHGVVSSHASDSEMRPRCDVALTALRVVPEGAYERRVGASAAAIRVFFGSSSLSKRIVMRWNRPSPLLDSTVGTAC